MNFSNKFFTIAFILVILVVSYECNQTKKTNLRKGWFTDTIGSAWNKLSTWFGGSDKTQTAAVTSSPETLVKVDGVTGSGDASEQTEEGENVEPTKCTKCRMGSMTMKVPRIK
jgi:hypothetical protein